MRFAVLVVLAPEPETQHTIASSQLVPPAALLQTLRRALQSSRLGHLQLVCQNNVASGEEEDWYLSYYNPRNRDGGSHFISRVVVNDEQESIVTDFGRYLDDRVHSHNSPPAEGPLHVELLLSKSRSNRAFGILINGNHALCDGRSLIHLVMELFPVKHAPPSYTTWSDKSANAMIPVDWKDLVLHACSERTEQWSDVPCYLGVGGENPDAARSMLTMQELATSYTKDGDSLPSSTGSDCLRFTTSESVMASLRTLLLTRSENQSRKRISFTGFLAAVLMNSVAIEYYGNSAGSQDNRGTTMNCSRNIGVSVLVDLRPFLANQDILKLPLAIGTVTLMLPCEAFLSPHRAAATTAAAVETLLSHAEMLTLQMQHRIHRGEALRSALALTTGRFDQGSPPATMELSNLGTCPLPSSAQLYTAQRFDDYDSVSCLVHSESSPALMRWCVSVGQGLESSSLVVKRIFSRAWNHLDQLGSAMKCND